ncbi:DNA gyrase subunit A [Candidatus Nomurabacteria bacterium RIFCSPHIGHO2_02_FULL_33_12]|uniref:DNA gyrase subunit A n=1 Tax=Candidatus Nomurabacteria bacterium RIFCSPLOWO2_01_FULL_33_17 TaxID=1801764 RepID=A0A1F6WPA1_9BACT|nr:MAG: DNA gyrase subunit A [Candidatus Nomurabacteria bacterium RIFCSPHIGHO2_02_FULL_33_12]OGI83703.1 MAG: DNA gyrase subunit A [Candidatus Nomurabacteria bacterium RIFCSPLOWO2_01_FULL_33_17]
MIEHDRIQIRPIVTEMRESYLDYAMSVITMRALPDIRDGLKPVHRRILYAMHEMGLTSGGRFRKSAAVVGEVLGKYHPHGDVAVYDSMVGMAQDFSYRYPLIFGQGNFGSIDGDNAAAMRYTEAKMSKISSVFLQDLEKDTVAFRPNYDQTRNEPIVLPTIVPGLLLNGTLGIAVGMATNIPPHNLGEVIDACLHFNENPESTTEDLMEFIQGPDFPTGAVAYDKKDILHAYQTGRGGVTVRGEAEIIEQKGGQFQIIVSSLPYRTNKANFVESIADLVRDKKIDGIKGLRDESTREMRVVVDLKSGAHPQKVLNYLYKHTQLESVFHYNLVALVDGIPQTLSLKNFIEEFIKHRREVITRRTKFDLNKARDREHILLGLKKALDFIDEVISIIRGSRDAGAAKEALIKRFKFSDLQATAILEMRLQKLAGLERKAVETELKEKQILIAELESILTNYKKVTKIIGDELVSVRAIYADDRKTKIVKGGLKSMNEEDLIPEKESVLVYTAGGYVKRTDPMEYRKQNRGGVGTIDIETKEEDFVTMLIDANTHADLLFFTNQGRAYQIRMYDIPEGKRATKGKSINNFISLGGDERVTSILPISKQDKAKFESLMLVTKNGTAKKVAYESFKDVRRSGLLAISLEKGDELISVLALEKGNEVLLVSSHGQSIRFKESDIRQMGRGAAGVIGMKLEKSDFIINVNSISKDKNDLTLFTISEKGLGKRTKLSEYKVQKRGGSGILTAKVTEKTGSIISARIAGTEGELIAISKKGQTLRTDMSSVPVLGRSTQGVSIMKLRAGDSLASLAVID